MGAYPQVYLQDVVENQGRLFDFIAQKYPDKETGKFIETYMRSKTRHAIDECQAYVATMSASELWQYLQEYDPQPLNDGMALPGFLPTWLGEFYAYYQWFYSIPSSKVISKFPVASLAKSYPALHDLALDLAVQKVGQP